MVKVTASGRTAAESPYLSTIVRHEGLYRRYNEFAVKLHTGGLIPARARELLLLRSAWLCQAPYEWEQHVTIAKVIGLSTDEIELVISGPDHPEWDPLEAALLRSVDELHAIGSLTDSTWEALAENLDETQLVELPVLVGMYHLIAYVMNSLRVPPEEGAGLGLDAR
jgi:alkylhydroperoxidase family enzyme